MKKSPARQSLEGVTFYSPSEAHFGFTLISPYSTKAVWLINMQGAVVKEWKTPYFSGTEGKIISNRNLLFAGKDEKGPLSKLEGAGGVLLELSPDNKKVWEYKDPYMHHRFCRLENGNTHVLKWIEVPAEIAAKVKGGFDKEGSDRKMWGDAIQEISPEGKVVWEWKAHEHLDPEKDTICPLCSRNEWTHATCIEALEDDKILVSFMRINEIAIIDKKSGDIEWKWGSEEVAHQNYATVLHDKTILIFDNGRHLHGEALSYSRSLIIDPEDKKIIGGYEEDPPNYFFSSFLGNVQKLDNNGMLMVEGTRGHLLELNYRNGMVWEYVNPVWGNSDEWGENNWISSAYRYGLDDEGLKRCLGIKTKWRTWLQVAKETYLVVEKPEEKKPKKSQEDAVRSRLENLGY